MNPARAASVISKLRAAAESGWILAAGGLKTGNHSEVFTPRISFPWIELPSFSPGAGAAEAYQSQATKRSRELPPLANQRKSSLIKYCWNEEGSSFLTLIL